MSDLLRELARQEEKLLNCVHCGFCLPACPTYNRLGDEADSPRGRLHFMRAVVEGRLEPASPAFQQHLDRCLGCRACESVCPSGVEYGHLLEGARVAAVQARAPGLLVRFVPELMARPALLAPVMLLARLLRGTGLPALAARRLPAMGWGGRLRLGMGMVAATARARIPEGGSGGAAATARARIQEGGSGGAAAAGRADAGGVPGPSSATPAPECPTLLGGGRPTALLLGCVQEALLGRVNRATARVLEANGYRLVEAPGQLCCGALHAHSGDLEGARELARKNLRAFQEAGIEVVAVNAAGCGATMKEYGHLLEEDEEHRERARAFSAQVRDVSELLGGEGIRRGGELPLRVAYDPPCHLLHAQRVAEAPLALLRSIPGLRLVPLQGAEECCGGAGIYGITHPELGGRIGEDKVEAILASGAQVVATGNPGCMMQIGAGLRMRGARVQVTHPVELLDESYRRGGIYGGRSA